MQVNNPNFGVPNRRDAV